MAGITVGGIGSGLDINSLVAQLVSAEAAPAISRLDRREASLQTELSGIGTFKGALSELQSAVTGLTGTRFQGMKATTGSSEFFTASADDSADAGDYSVEVKHLAQVQKLATSANSVFASTTDVVGQGSITFEFGSYETGPFVANAAKTATTLTFDTDMTLEGLRDAINEADFGVKTNIVNDGNGYRLVLSGTDTGAANALRISVADADGNPTDEAGLSQLAFDLTDPATAGRQTLAARDAEVVVDGLTVHSAGNTLTEVVKGVTLTLKKPGEAALSVAEDTAAASGAVQAFVNAYNKLVETTALLTAYNPETQERGALLGDAGVRTITGQLRGILAATYGDTDSGYRSLSQLGISAQRDGTLAFDSGKLQEALKTDPQAVATLFSRDSEDEVSQGVADRLADYLAGTLNSSGPLDARSDSINGRIDDIGDEREILDRRLEALEIRYRAQFTAMDQLVAELTATGNFLSQQLAGMANIYDSDS